jgi:toxin ParE1/3/4
MQLKWLRKALRNLDEEASRIAEDDPIAARLVVERVLQAVAMLEEQPALGRPGRVAGTRELVVLKTRYIVPYRVRGGTVEVLRVFHTSRRVPAACDAMPGLSCARLQPPRSSTCAAKRDCPSVQNCRCCPAGAACHGLELDQAVLVRVLGVDGFAGAEHEGAALHSGALRVLADQVHLDPLVLGVEPRFVAERTEAEVAASSRLMRTSRFLLNAAVTPRASS